jgi:hypothetical protein
VHLTQTADGHGTDFITFLGTEVAELSKRAWQTQQVALQKMVEAEYGG